MLPKTGEASSLLTILFGFVGMILGAMIFTIEKTVNFVYRVCLNFYVHIK